MVEENGTARGQLGPLENQHTTKNYGCADGAGAAPLPAAYQLQAGDGRAIIA
jgi:hypothetical protein